MVGVAVVLLFLNSAWIGNHRELLRPVTPGDLAPRFVLPAIDAAGKLVHAAAVDSTSLAGKVVLVDFWATWCAPCRESLPAIDRVYSRYRDRGLVVVSINTDDPAAGRAMFDALGVSVPLYYDDGTVARRFKVASIPHLVLIDPIGVIRGMHHGFHGEEELDAQVRALLDAR